MLKNLHILLFLIACLSANAQLQEDPEARKMLDRFSARAQGDYPVQISFEYVYESLIEKETYNERGSLILNKDQFRLRFGESDVYCDGNTIWNHLPMVDEVYLSDAEDSQVDDEFFISNPGEFFTFYQDGFNYQLKGEIDYAGQKYYEIDLYPVDLNRNYHTIKLLISSSDFSLYSAEALGKNGVNHTVIIVDYMRKVNTDENTFVFKPDDHPGIEIIDTRF